MTIHELRASRAKAYDQFEAICKKADYDKTKDGPVYDKLLSEIEGIDESIERETKRLEIQAKGAVQTEGQAHRTYAAPKDDPWTDDACAARKGLVTSKGLIIGGIAKMIAASGGSFADARLNCEKLYGENHPIHKALIAGIGTAGGFIVPPEYVNEIIELLRPMAVVRSANPRTMPMPRGTMTLPSQASAATATYGGEHTPITASQPGLGQIVATYKKLKALVPISNDLMRFSDPAADAIVRDDLVKVTALREDLAFLMGDGTQDSPRGMVSFANSWAMLNSGTAGTWSATAASVWAVGGNFITSNPTYTLSTVAQELAGLINKLDTANVPDMRRMWFMHPRSWNYLNNVQNSLGLYPYRDEMSKGTLLGYPFKKSTQIAINIWDSGSTNKDCSFVILCEMTDAMILDAMTLEIAISREGTYQDSNNVTQSAFSNDETIIRGIMEHDFQMRHAASVAVAQEVRWAPAIS